MTIEIKLVEPPFSDTFSADLIQITKEVFPNEADEWYSSREWRFKNMPSVACFFAYDDSNIIGYKIGYAVSHNIFYSWLGGVNSEYRNKGIASQLIVAMQEYAKNKQFRLIETHVEQHNKIMINFNIKHGMSIVGMYLEDTNPYYIMQKKIEK